MAEVLKTLGQSNPAADTLTDAYTVPAATTASISSIVICNRSTTGTTFRIAVSPGGAAIDNKHYIYFDMPVPANDTFIATIGITMEATSKVRVYAQDANLSFNIFGTEIT